MNLDIQTEHVLMRPEWHRMIEEWLALGAKAHPDLAAVDLTLRSGERPHTGNQVHAVARAGGRILRVDAQGDCMTIALHDALDALEREVSALGMRRDRSKAA